MINSTLFPVPCTACRFGVLDPITKNGKALKIMTFYSPTYSVKFYREGMYKLIKFNSPRGCCIHDRESENHTGEKLEAAVSRAKSVIYQLAVCNDWEYFFTGTISAEKLNRYDLFSFRERFAQYVRDLRKKSGYENLAYVLVPEKHKDGAWHLHGLIRGVPESSLSFFVPSEHPEKLVVGGYRNWSDYADKFGFCSLGKIRDAEAVSNYLTKYISKDLASSVSVVGGHTYYCSRGLRRAIHFGDVFGGHVCLDAMLENHGRFVSTGYVHDCSWDFWLDFIDLSTIDWFPCDEDPVSELILSEDVEQCVIAGFPISSYQSPYGGVV